MSITSGGPDLVRCKKCEAPMRVSGLKLNIGPVIVRCNQCCAEHKVFKGEVILTEK